MEALQWIGAALGVAGAYAVASERASVRGWGFAGFLASNVCWIAWGYAGGTWGLVAMQAAFCLTSLRGFIISRRLAQKPAEISAAA